jgi:hypothetical protein
MFDNVSATTPFPPDGPEPMDTTLLSAAVQRFQTCQWPHQPKDGSVLKYCAHRDVQPMTGTAGFDPQAWCLDCRFYKVRRHPQKRLADDFQY